MYFATQGLDKITIEAVNSKCIWHKSIAKTVRDKSLSIVGWIWEGLASGLRSIISSSVGLGVRTS